MSSRSTTTDRLFRCYGDLEALLDDLQPDEWGAQSLCPAWTVRGVVCHLASIEHALDGWVPTGEETVPPFEAAGAFLEATRGWSDEEIGVETRAILARRRTQLLEMSDAEFADRSMTPVGEATYHRFMDIRIFDLWVHQRDMTVPLGRATVDGDPAGVTALGEVQRSIGYIVGRKVGLDDGLGITFHLGGPIPRDIAVAVDGRATEVTDLTDPVVEVTTDSTTFILLACGRLNPDTVISSGRITWTGDDTWGERAARNLAFTM